MAVNRIWTLDKTKLEWMMIHSDPQSLNRRSKRQRSSQEAALLHIAVQISLMPSSCGAFVRWLCHVFCSLKRNWRVLGPKPARRLSRGALFDVRGMCMKDVRKQISAWWVLPVHIGKESTILYLYLVYLNNVYLCDARILTDSDIYCILQKPFVQASLPISYIVVKVIVSY